MGFTNIINKVRPVLPWGLAILSLMMILILAMTLGAENVSLPDLYAALFTNETNNGINILREIRFPRIVAALLVGAALGVSGAVMQGMTRNPLADPGLLGVSSGANMALAMSMAFLPELNYYGIMMASLMGAALGSLLVLGLGASRLGGFTPLRMVLAGAAVSAFLTALSEGIGIYFKLTKFISMWTAGGLMGTNWEQVKVIGLFIGVGLAIALATAKQLTILSLSEEVAISLGQNTFQVKVILFFANIVLTGSAVALAGNMAFVGLIVPHFVRSLVGTDYRRVIPMSMLTGGTFIVFADFLARMIGRPYETPMVAVVSMLGLPIFLLLAKRGGRSFI